MESIVFGECAKMAASYKKLWKLLIDKDMKKKDLRMLTGLSSSTIAKMTKNEPVSTEVIIKICHALECDIGDVMEIVPDGTKMTKAEN